ncbi:MAG: hypothetical protein E5Y55_24225 [Mesorhizobium sp.]|uniref:hypothetical protein n=1 Tax=Mesorhizobium sp. TaxID=1871066 RepID=UPI0011F6A529|nr:hypothetical protein [Mesorhizobium sp.]TIM41789.1 MAG: hypothetical protein E5Y55_24225 [Mesorhizobium sp.]
MLVSTRGVYRTRSGKRVGPLRPFRYGEDTPAIDLMGLSAWFYFDGVGAFSKDGAWLTGGFNSPNDLVAEWEGDAEIDRQIPIAEGARELTVGTAIPMGTLLAEVHISGDKIRISKAWVEGTGGVTHRLDGQGVDTLGMFHSGRWRTFRSVIEAAALAEVAS